jgi:hypothetical protein
MLVFLKSDYRSQWFGNDIIDVYVRKSKRSVNDQVYDCFDIATITIHKQGEHIFTKMLDIIERDFNKNIFVESILEPRLFSFLEKRGYIYKDNYKTDMIKINQI